MSKDDDAIAVWSRWLRRQKRPANCRFTTERKALIKDRLGLGYSVSDLLTLIRYAYESDADEARWWRGENPTGKLYLDLSNLLVKEKLGRRVQNALTWLDELLEGRSDPSPIASTAGRAGTYRTAQRTRKD